MDCTESTWAMKQGAVYVIAGDGVYLWSSIAQGVAHAGVAGSSHMCPGSQAQ